MIAAATAGAVSRTAAVIAPGVMVMAMIMFMGKISGAHYNPAVTLAFALREDFPWRRVPGYLIAQLIGGVCAALLLQWVVNVSASAGATSPGDGVSGVHAMIMEAVLTLGLISVVLGTASGAQNVGIIGALAIGGYIALAGLWASPISDASMNPVRSLAPAIVANDYTSWWVYLLGPLIGVVLAVVFAYFLRGRGGGKTGSHMAQGELHPEVSKPEKN